MNQNRYCPCITPQSNETCSSTGCIDEPYYSIPGYYTSENNPCINFNANNIPKCYCNSILNDLIQEEGVIWQLSSFLNPTQSNSIQSLDVSDEHCSDIIYYYSTSTLAVLVMIVIALISSYVIQKIILANVPGEYHKVL